MRPTLSSSKSNLKSNWKSFNLTYFDTFLVMPMLIAYLSSAALTFFPYWYDIFCVYNYISFPISLYFCIFLFVLLYVCISVIAHLCVFPFCIFAFCVFDFLIFVFSVFLYFCITPSLWCITSPLDPRPHDGHKTEGGTDP